ncbi:histidine phosphatase superfamily [Xylariales sp. PMI_506]|nr:histidine phosphatase superfamily [Xylariales sp. PMI_506]
MGFVYSGAKPFLQFLLLAHAVVAQETVWSAFAYILNGERTPLLGPSMNGGRLTPLGAQQMLSQGSALRSRWLVNTTSSESSSTANSSASTAISNAPIVGIGHSAIDNAQISIYSATDEYVTGSALAFLQGLYPPALATFSGLNGVEAAMLANGSTINFPLNGYQYPNIQTFAPTDPNSIWISGQMSCYEYYLALNKPDHDDEWKALTLQHYQQLWNTTFAGTFPESMVNYDFAYSLYDYASYQYEHNGTVARNLSYDEITWLGEFASIHEFNQNGNLSVSGVDSGDKIRAISGRTLAGKVISQFQNHVNSRGLYDKLTLTFGTYEPFLAFFSLADLPRSGPSSALFREIPQPGATMVFELFSVNTSTTSLPSRDELWVRFSYRSGTDNGTKLLEYPMFGQGLSSSEMKYRDFVTQMNAIAINSLESWCHTCGSNDVQFCNNIEDARTPGSSSSSSSSASHHALSPVAAGFIGASVTLAVFSLAAGALFIFGGFRIRRNDSDRNLRDEDAAAADTTKKRASGSLGGFRGAEKMDSDLDVSVIRGGIKHVRAGSWELKPPPSPVPPPRSPTPQAGVAEIVRPETAVVVDIPPRTSLRRRESDADSFILGGKPVEPHESI